MPDATVVSCGANRATTVPFDANAVVVTANSTSARTPSKVTVVAAEEIGVCASSDVSYRDAPGVATHVAVIDDDVVVKATCVVLAAAATARDADTTPAPTSMRGATPLVTGVASSSLVRSTCVGVTAVGVADDWMAACTWVGLNAGLASKTSAATPATCGADADVPPNDDQYGPTSVSTLVGPAMST